MRADNFFNRVLKDNVLKSLFIKFNSEIWDKLSDEERKNIFVTIADRVNLLYPDLGKCSLDIVNINSIYAGKAYYDYIVLDVDSFNNGKQFEILYDFIHERRHVYQKVACDLYDRHKIVHELFDKEYFNEIYKNNCCSMFGRANNYLISNENNNIEYNMQPMEYDAELFAKEFIELFSKEFLIDAKDKKICKQQSEYFDSICAIFEENETNIINFSNIYKLNIEDHYSINEKVFDEDKALYDKCVLLLSHLNDLKLEELMLFATYYVWGSLTTRNKISVLNRLLSIKECQFDIKYLNDTFIINGKKVKDECFDVMELVFSEIADKEIEKILAKKDDDKLMQIEIDIKINLKSEKTIIKEKENPLFYNIQPYMLYKNKYIYDLFELIGDTFVDVYKNDIYNFQNYIKYIKKYDVSSIAKKIEIITGESIKDVYFKMVSKMKDVKTR